MKKLSLLLGLGLLVSHFSNTAFACSPPPPGLAQKMNLERVITSNEFHKAFNEELSKDIFTSIAQIDFNGGIKVHLTNGCTIAARLNHAAPRAPGLCPKFTGVTTQTICP
jgi:hypothetical protein